MSNAFYAKGAEAILTGQVNLLTAAVKAALVKNTYAEDLASHDYYNDISAHVIGVPQPLTGKSVTGGVFDANDITYSAVAAGDTGECVVLFVDTGDPATSLLLARIDQITSFPVATNGADVQVQWDNGAYKIISLV